MPVGDVTSKEAGSGARYNDDKPPMHQVPVRYWSELWALQIGAGGLAPIGLNIAISALQRFQEGEDHAIRRTLCDRSALLSAMAVFQYGQEKYALYNWTKGMQWSIPTACAMRHIQAIVEGEKMDPESGLPHIGHVWCNLIMLDWFVDHYPEGDDRPHTRRHDKA